MVKKKQDFKEEVKALDDATFDVDKNSEISENKKSKAKKPTTKASSSSKKNQSKKSVAKKIEKVKNTSEISKEEVADDSKNDETIVEETPNNKEISEIAKDSETMNDAEVVSKDVEGSKTESLEKEYQELESEVMMAPTSDGLGLSQEIVDEKIKQALETQSPKKRRKSTIVNLCLLLLNLILMFFIVKGLIEDVGDMSFSSIVSKQGGRLWWLAGGVLIYLVYMLAQTLMYKVLIKDFTGKTRWWLSYDVAIVGKYYDNITPFAVGGQPFQIVRLVQNDVSAGVATSIPIIKMIINTAINALVAVLFFVFGMPLIPTTSSLNSILLLLFEILGVIGLVITVVVVLFMFLVSSGSLFTRSFISGLLRLGYKLKIVKNYRKTFKKVLNQVSEYKLSMSYLWKHKLLLLKMIVLSILECLSYAMIPYFVAMAFAVNLDMSPMLFIVVCIAKYYICTMASSFIPLPGGTGLIEITFIFLFGSIVGDSIVWALLIWRILSYYLIIAHGFVHELGQITHNFIKNSKKRKIA